MALLHTRTRVAGRTGERLFDEAKSDEHAVPADAYIYEPAFLPGLEASPKGQGSGSTRTAT